MRAELLLDVSHRQVVFVIPRMLRIFFKYKRRLLGQLCRSAVQAFIKYFQAVSGTELVPEIVAVIQTFGQKINFHPHVHLWVTEEARIAMAASITSPLSRMASSLRCSPGSSSHFSSGRSCFIVLGEARITSCSLKQRVRGNHY
ncbi:MAG: transposase [Candidatus Aminicenantaceae bacterium]